MMSYALKALSAKRLSCCSCFIVIFCLFFSPSFHYRALEDGAECGCTGATVPGSNSRLFFLSLFTEPLSVMADVTICPGSDTSHLATKLFQKHGFLWF